MLTRIIAKGVRDRLEGLQYEENPGKLKSALEVLRTGKAKCFEGALVAAYLMNELLDLPPTILSMVTDVTKINAGREVIQAHAVFIFEDFLGCSTLGFSRDINLRSKLKFFKSRQEIIDEYRQRLEKNGYNLVASMTYNLDRFGIDWRKSPNDIYHLVRAINHLDLAPIS